MSTLYIVSYALYLILYYVTGYRKTVVENNLGYAFPEKNTKEIAGLARLFYRQLADVALEIIKARVLDADDYAKRVTIKNPEIFEEYRNQQQSLIVLSIHACNWEWMLHAMSTQLNIPIDAIYKPLHNKTIDQLIYNIRSRFGTKPLSMHDSTRNVMKKRREFRILTMVADQSPIARERSYWTTFMNQPAAFYQGSEKIAKLTKCPVIFAAMKRTSRGHYQVEFEVLAEPPYKKDSNEILDRYITAAEKTICEQPESWLWSNRRWKRKPMNKN
tara:strand:- start:553 stop:1371 length:819 start_codon:yes stop_codon:yes gene_type:complete